QGNMICRAGAKRAHMRGKMRRMVGGCGRCIPGRYCHPMDMGVHIDPRSVPMGHVHWFMPTCLAKLLLDTWRHSGLLKQRLSTRGRERGRRVWLAVSQTGTRAGAPPMMSTHLPGPS